MNLAERLGALTWEERDQLEDSDLVSDAVVIIRALDPETGRNALYVNVTEGTDDMTISGLLHAATVVHDVGWQKGTGLSLRDEGNDD